MKKWERWNDWRSGIKNREALTAGRGSDAHAGNTIKTIVANASLVIMIVTTRPNHVESMAKGRLGWRSPVIQGGPTHDVAGRHTPALPLGCSSARKCADHAIELVLPEPAECWIRNLPPAPSSRTLACSFRVASSW